MSVAREPPEAVAADGTGHAGGGASSSGGSNARSFRFLLTLALRKAQTAVTLDNGGHVDEAIRTYREAISMLGLVLDRTSEEDGRQRLLHFRQTYSDRVSVLSSLRPSAAAAPSPVVDSIDPHRRADPPRLIATDADHQRPQPVPMSPRPSESQPRSPWSRAALIPSSSSAEQTLASESAAHGADGGSRRPTVPGSPTPAQRRPAQGPANLRPLAPSMLAMDMAQRLTLGPPGELLGSPVDKDKPLPPILDAPHSPVAQRKLSAASSADAATDSAAVGLEPEADHSAADAGGEPQPAADKQPAAPAQPDLSDHAESAADVAESSDRALRRKDQEKASRRQSVKNQRSLPAMFNIGAKPRSESRAPPPVPPLVVTESSHHNNSTTHFGRRLLGALRSTPAGDPQAGRAGVTRGDSEDMGASDAPRGDSTDRAAGLPGLGPGAASVDEEPPPPTPSKDNPPLPEKTYGKTLTREQKRQSNAAHRLVGLFKRKASIPEIPASALPARFPADAGLSQSPPSGQMMPMDRRLSASASTPNLFEAAAAAASSDQPALAVYQATERGVLPPMPAPPTLGPGAADDVIISAASDRGPAIEAAPRAERDGAANGAAPARAGHARRPSQQLLHPPTGRPPLRIATKSALDVLTYVPEDAPLPRMPLTAGIEGAARGRKLSINTTASQPQPRTSGAATPGIVGGGGRSLEAPGHPIYGRATLTDVEEDQRLEMSEPAFGTFHADLGPPPAKGSPLSALWFIGTLHRSMVSSGAHLTPSLYVPRRLWFQSGIRIAAIDAKLGVLNQLTQAFAAIGTQLTLPDVDTLMALPGALRDEHRAEAAPWESEDAHSPTNRDKDDLHRTCLTLHQWLNGLEETLDSSRRLLSKRLKFVAASAAGPQAHALPPPPLAGAPAENPHGSVLNMSITPFYGSEGMPAAGANGFGSSLVNGSLQSLVLGHGDLGASSSGVLASPLSPGGDPAEARLSETRSSEAPNGAVPVPSVNKDALTKDQLGNSRFKGLGKLGKSVDRIYSTMQKEKLDDTSAYVAALQRLFEAAMVLEDLMHYFARIAGDVELAGWFAEAPQSPAPLPGRRGPADAAPSSPAPPPRTALVSEPSMSSMNSGSDRKSSSASIPNAAALAAEKKIRRRSNYFGQRPLATGLPEGADALGAPNARAGTKPRGDSLSVIPRLVPAVPPLTAAAPAGAAAHRFVLAQSPIKNPASYVRQGRGHAPGVIYARLSKITEWLSQVLVAWVVRDIQVLYAKYIKRLREWSVE